MLLPSIERSPKSDQSAKNTLPLPTALQIKGLKILLCCVFSLMLIFLHTDLLEDLAYIPLLRKAIKTIFFFFSPLKAESIHGLLQQFIVHVKHGEAKEENLAMILLCIISDSRRTPQNK